MVWPGSNRGVAYVLTEVGSTHVSRHSDYVMESRYTTSVGSMEGIVAHKVAVDVLSPCSMSGQNDIVQT